MDEVAIDVDQRGAIIEGGDDMIVPDFCVEGAGGGAHAVALAALAQRNPALLWPGLRCAETVSGKLDEVDKIDSKRGFFGKHGGGGQFAGVGFVWIEATGIGT
ncbi:hypothetical protein GCM10007973_30930 [Polymorphobacter multimanifer]|nr:hypothetical protein GCM10007973_30930 [Polymorphobacter multimanifer]